ncbi:MAG TPA: trehalase family glycosidase, partial [Victivallales bacterium]|nr:trehalase family glycosidase [Victivallales bacterium]
MKGKIRYSITCFLICSTFVIFNGCGLFESKPDNKPKKTGKVLSAVFNDKLTQKDFEETLKKPEPYPSRQEIENAITEKNSSLCYKLLSERYFKVIKEDLKFTPDDRPQSFMHWERNKDGIPFLVPSPGIYATSSWKWDLVFSAMITSDMASKTNDKEEKESLYALAKGCMISVVQNQIPKGYDKGMIPHMNFNDKKDQKFWGLKYHSSITQPPITVLGVKSLPNKNEHLAFYPALTGEIEWWLKQRMDGGLPYVIHPWETGRYAARDTDSQLIQYFDFKAFNKKKVGKYYPMSRGLIGSGRVKLLRELKKINKMPPSKKAKKLFELRSPDMAAYLIMALRQTADFAAEQNDYKTEVKYRDRADSIAKAVNAKMWDEKTGFYYSLGRKPSKKIIKDSGLDPKLFKVDNSGKIMTMVGSTFVTLAAGIPDVEQSVELLDKLENKKLFDTMWPVPMVAANDPGYISDEYWRGSTWLNINYFIIQGLVKYGDRFVKEGHVKLANRFYNKALELSWKSVSESSVGYYEFFSSNKKGKLGLGAHDFAWSGLILNIIININI